MRLFKVFILITIIIVFVVVGWHFSKLFCTPLFARFNDLSGKFAGERLYYPCGGYSKFMEFVYKNTFIK